MIELLKYVTVKFPRTLSTRVNQLVRRANRIVKVTFEVTSTPRIEEDEDNFIIVLPYYPDSGASSSAVRGFTCIDGSTGGVSQIRVYRGTIESVAPSGMNLGDSPPFYVAASGSGVVWISITVDEDGFTDLDSPRAIGVNATMPANTDDTLYREVGSFTTVDGKLVVQSSGIGDQSFELCGGIGGEPHWGPA